MNGSSHLKEKRSVRCKNVHEYALTEICWICLNSYGLEAGYRISICVHHQNKACWCLCVVRVIKRYLPFSLSTVFGYLTLASEKERSQCSTWYLFIASVHNAIVYISLCIVKPRHYTWLLTFKHKFFIFDWKFWSTDR